MSATTWPEGWPAPNYEDPPTRGGPALFIVMCVLTAMVVSLRLYSRSHLTRSLALDDGLLIAGFILSIGQTFAEYKALTTWGWNMHLWDVPFDRLMYVRLAAWLVEIFFLLGNACVKVSILLVYRKISSGSHNYWFIRLIWAAIAFTVVYTVALGLELLLICRPLNSYWKSYDPTYAERFTCGNEHIPIVFSAAASVFSDIYASVLPMLLTRKLNLSRKQRLSLYALFSAGLLTAGIGLARMYFLVKVTTNYKPGPHTHDVTWYGWPMFALTDVEAHLAMICACAPALKILFQRQLSGQISHVHASIRSNSFRRAPSRTYHHHQQSSSKTEHDTSPYQTIQRGQRSQHRYGAPSFGDAEQDVENLSLQSMETDKPLASRVVHIAELCRPSPPHR